MPVAPADSSADDGAPLAASLRGTQTIFRVRRDYNSWVADETLEDYALRYAPTGFRKWSEWRVANTAYGAVSFLALEAIGGTIAMNYGFANALWAILFVGLITFLTALPISVYAARHGVDMDLLTRGAGFGYLGSTMTSLIYASFTFIFFALEAAIMALALQLAFDWPLLGCYLVSALVIVPLVTHGITFISRLQAWTQPIWLVLLLWPFAWFAFHQPQLYRDFAGLSGQASGSSDFDLRLAGAAATVAFALVVQVGEQVDFLRFLPRCSRANRGRWWGAVLMAGPGWVLPGMLKMLGGAFLAFVALQSEIDWHRAVEPTQMYLAGFRAALGDPGLALAVTVVFVILSQVKINVTNAYAGSLAWSNFFARLTHSHPGRVVWVVFNVFIALMLMTLGVFSALEHVLGFYSNIAIAWVGAIVADLVINKPLGLSPPGLEFRRAYLYDLNPVGLGSMGIAALVSIVAHVGLLGPWLAAFSPVVALATALVTAPLIAWGTKGRYYLAARTDGDCSSCRVNVGGDGRPCAHAGYRPARKGQPAAAQCSVCENTFEIDDMAACPVYAAPICSLCCTLESRCQDRCKVRSRAVDQLHDLLARLLPRRVAHRVNSRVAQSLLVFIALSTTLGSILTLVYVQESLLNPQTALAGPLIKLFALLTLVSAVCAWWIVLASESRSMAHEESFRQTQRLLREIDAHRRTDKQLQAAKEVAEAASRAKTRYVAGMTHELRTPLNSILGYTQVLQRHHAMSEPVRTAVSTIERSGEHMHALIDGLLDLARIEAGRLRLDLAPMPLDAFLHELVSMVQPQADAKGLAFELERIGRQPAWVVADSKRLRQILLNLLGNAVRFTEVGSLRLRVDATKHVLRFEVVDTGIGIEPQDQERIFQPFERGSAGRRVEKPGTGLGLTITHLLTELMGGVLTVDSTPGVGSRFTVRLYLREVEPPLAGAPGTAPTLAQQARLLRPVVGYEGRRRRLLVVDDQPIQRQLLAAMLVPLGFDVHEAASGREALAQMGRLRPDALLLDLTMDDLDGWQTAEQVRAQGWAEVALIFVSANLYENRPEALARAGAAGFVGKPVLESQLLAVLATSLGLTWRREDPAAQMLPPAQPAPPPAPGAMGALPVDVASELRQLARLGHAQGLRERLVVLAADPVWAAECAALQQHLSTFNFEAIISRLPVMEDAE
ncbi:ATP-binding protein [Roseateles cellulosilyticus]|uniref:histidine kinase n=1 Tax=Pelomonas cellulosilytica TaxID=2906762 RepID=A0ABS8XP50_9BURK|nr:ATP-binding protein [Pelomonas sp. P8]MCE4554544.1 ATP-binding protein [Pelomonas sp. P8]